jgi:dihydroneopterin aldolase
VPATLSIVDLKLSCHLGVPDAERRKAQTVLCSAWFPVPHMASAARADDLRKTVDYRTPRKLLERLATDLARVACHRFSLPWVEIELKKFILPQTRHVSLRARFSKKELL